MWGIYAFLSALFGGTNAVVAKLGLKGVDGAVATVIRTTVVLAASALALWAGGELPSLAAISLLDAAILAAAGIATAASWICYFRALSVGRVEIVAALDKASVPITMLGGALFLGESLSAPKLIALIPLLCGIILMAGSKSTAIDNPRSDKWLISAILSMLFLSASTLLSKSATHRIPPETALFVRTGAVLICSTAYLAGKHRSRALATVTRKSALFLLISGACTGLGWICSFRALAGGPAGAVHAIEKLAILPTVILSRILWQRLFSRRYLAGLASVIAGILILYFAAMG